MITKNTYYKNNVYIPHAKPSITSDVTTVSAELEDFIYKYERICLVKCLGLPLFLEFEAVLDKTQANGLKVGADEKWNELLNGKTYTNSAGEAVQWRGIRYKSKPTATEPDVSFLANFVYINYEQNYDVFRTGVGHAQPKGRNVEERSPAQKVTLAMREMVEAIQGRETKGVVLRGTFGFGIDFYNNTSEVSLYQFIKDMNNVTEDTYPNFTPSYWDELVNQFGI